MARRVYLTRRKNPAGEELPYGEWIPAHAVKFNADGTASLMTEPVQNRGRRLPNVADGFVDARGVFHPIRWASDYDPDRASEDSEYSISPSPAYYRKHGLKAPKKTKKKKRRR